MSFRDENIPNLYIKITGEGDIGGQLSYAPSNGYGIQGDRKVKYASWSKVVSIPEGQMQAFILDLTSKAYKEFKIQGSMTVIGKKSNC